VQSQAASQKTGIKRYWRMITHHRQWLVRCSCTAYKASLPLLSGRAVHGHQHWWKLTLKSPLSPWRNTWRHFYQNDKGKCYKKESIPVNRMKTCRPSDNPDNNDSSMDPAFLEISQPLESRVIWEKKQKLKHINLMILKLKLKLNKYRLTYLHHQ